MGEYLRDKKKMNLRLQNQDKTAATKKELLLSCHSARFNIKIQ